MNKQPTYPQTLATEASDFLHDYPATVKDYPGTRETPAEIVIKWTKEPELNNVHVERLVGSYLSNERDWSEFIHESNDRDLIQTVLVSALNGTATAKDLGETMMKVAKEYHQERILKEFIEKVEQEVLGENH